MYILGYIYYLKSTWAGSRTAETGAHRPGPLARSAGAARKGLAALKIWRTRRAVTRELAALPDRTLRDIGYHRGEIPEVVDAIVRREAAAAALGEAVKRHPAKLNLSGCG